MTQKACVICGTHFEAQSNRKTCSDECGCENARRVRNALQRKWYARNREKILEEWRLRKSKKFVLRTCVICESMFPREGNRKTCSPDCSETLRYRTMNRPRPRMVRVHTCAQCGKDFTPNAPIQKLCSAECKREWVSEKGKLRFSDWYSKNKERVSEYGTVYRSANKERIAVRRRNHYESNKEELLTKAKERRKANPEKMADTKRSWVRRNPEKYKEQRLRQRISKRTKKMLLQIKLEVHKMENHNVN